MPDTKKTTKKAAATPMDAAPAGVPERLEIEMLPVELLDAHPENRDVKNPECESLAESIRARGVREPVTVRRHPLSPGRHQIVSGHRRVVAARMAGLDAIPAMVREMGDLEALELVLVSNLERMELDPAEEARGVAALAKAGLTPEVLAERLRRSREWVQLRLALGDLPAPMREAVAERRVSLGAVAQVLRCEAEDRERAIQLVLRPTMQNVPLSADQSREVLEREILGPQKRRADWEKGMAKRLAAWKERLAPVAKAAGAPATLTPLEWDAKLPGGNLSYALEALAEDDLLPGAPEGATLAHLAIRHGQPVFVAPAAKARWLHPEGTDWGIGDDPESIILVDENALHVAEQELRDAEHPAGEMVAWLGSPAGAEGGKLAPWQVEREAKDAMVTELAAELEAAVVATLLPMCYGKTPLVVKMWRGVYVSFSDEAVSLDMASRIAGHSGVPYDEEEAKEWSVDLQEVGEARKWPQGWPLLAGYAENLLGVTHYMLGRKKEDGTWLLLPASVERIRSGLAELEMENRGLLPKLHELLEASEAAA